MRPEIHKILGDPIPPSLVPLAEHIEAAIRDAELVQAPLANAQREIHRLSTALNVKTEKLEDARHLRPRNVGGHYYPGCDCDPVRTSNCLYCKCQMGAATSWSPEGVDQFGECPGNPNLRVAYELLKQELEALKNG